MSGLFSLESWSTVWTHRESFLLGLGNTLQTAVCALALAFIIGAALGLMSTSGSKLLRIIARIYVEFVQNTPLLLQLCFLYYALAFAGVSRRASSRPHRLRASTICSGWATSSCPRASP